VDTMSLRPAQTIHTLPNHAHRVSTNAKPCLHHSCYTSRRVDVQTNLNQMINLRAEETAAPRMLPLDTQA
jgi:hypothetical protein